MEITVFSNGDSRLKKTWSGVPFYFTEALERQGIKLNRVNIEYTKPFLYIMYTYNKIIKKLCSKMSENGHIVFNTLERSRFYTWLKDLKIRRALRKYPNADYNLIFDFSTEIPAHTQKNIMLCDWTIDYIIRIQNHRQPNKSEQKCIRRQEKVMKRADYIVTLFPYVKEYLDEKFDNIYYLGNGINSQFYSDDVIKERYSSTDIIFIGGKKYSDGAKRLIEAVKMYNSTAKRKITLNIIGMTENYLNVNDTFINCYGYLNKDDEKENKLYYELIKKSKFFINPSKNWIGAQSLMEAFYWKLPTIVTPNDELLKLYGGISDFKGGGGTAVRNRLKYVLC